MLKNLRNLIFIQDRYMYCSCACVYLKYIQIVYRHVRASTSMHALSACILLKYTQYACILYIVKCIQYQGTHNMYEYCKKYTVSTSEHFMHVYCKIYTVFTSAHGM